MRSTIGTGALLAVFLYAGLADPVRGQDTNVVIDAFESPGKLVFTGSQDIAYFQVQWAPDPDGPWTNFTGEAGAGLDLIPRLADVTTAAVPMVYRVIGTPAPSGMVFIPAGSFSMGDSFGEGAPNELPVHTVEIDHFFIDRYEVSKALWDDVYMWATNNHYAFEQDGAAKSNDHPVVFLAWYDCVKWANARSEKEELTVCYTSSGGVYRAGIDTDVVCDFSAEGYRLPTEAEWEKAARGGTPGTRFPWSDTNTIQHARANYFSDGVEDYDASPTSGYHPAYSDGTLPYTSPVGSFAPNGYGLYDMAGNASEWCWDWYDPEYYDDSPSENPTGPPSSVQIPERVLRGGYYNNLAIAVRVANRLETSPATPFVGYGFRTVRGL